MSCQGCVLVVEDDPDNREALRQHLEGLGCRVVAAVDGADGLERLALLLEPCLVLADLNMPKLDGVGLVGAMRSQPRHGRTPIVTMSAEPSRERPPHVDAHLDKPFSLADLSRIIARLCRGGPPREREALRACGG